MPPETDNSDRGTLSRGTLSLPELDPLLNPILAQNMSRWAAVYFASAPENREQAVFQLLRQLEAEDAVRESAEYSPPFIAEHNPAPAASADSQMAEAQLHSVDCQGCGQENPADNNFCSMCGALLETQAPASGQRSEDVHVLQVEPVLSIENQHSYRSRPAPVSDEPAIPARESSRVPPDYEFRSSNYTLHFGRYSEPASHSYRVYIGAAMAILAAALIFAFWRGRPAMSESSPAPAQAPSAVTEQPAAPDPDQSTPARSAPQDTSQAEPESVFPADLPVVSSRGPAEKASDRAVPGNGSEELAIALSYLNGVDGKQRNTGEALQWLWKAVAKRNADATLRLSDLYLKGDGVPKNCDQARVLLDAAAGRGISGAAVRLRHLQAFGCE